VRGRLEHRLDGLNQEYLNNQRDQGGQQTVQSGLNSKKTALHVHHESYAVTCLEGLPQHRTAKFSHGYLTQSVNLVESVSS
jgi:hypothetical protein